MYFFFVSKNICSPFSILYHTVCRKSSPLLPFFCIWLYIGLYSTLIFVSNGDSLDWRGLNCEQMLERIIPKTQSGDIILFHNDTAHTAESLDKILTELEGKGFSFLKVSDLIYKDNYTIDHTGRQIKQ